MSGGGAHDTAPNGPPPSNPQSAPNLVAFDPKLAVPSQPLYLQRNDQLAFNAMSNAVGAIIRLNYRWLTPQGEIKEGEFDTPPFTGSTFWNLPIYEGWLLSFAVRTNSVNSAGQWTFLQALVTRSPLPSATSPNQAVIWQGFVPFNAPNGWPGTPSKEITDGPAVFRSITGTAPAAGAEISEVVPSNRRWTLLTFRSTITTSATAANRQPGFILDDGLNTFYNERSTTIIAASANGAITLAPANQFYSDGFNNTLMPAPGLIILRSGNHIKTNTFLLQAGDQWAAPQYTVLEWGSWDL